MISVVDTSAVMRLFIPDGPLPDGLEQALNAADRGDHCLIAPQLMVAEAANVLRRRVVLGELEAEEGMEILVCLLELPLRLHDHEGLAADAYELALKYGLSGYDGLFLSLAWQQNANLFSCDRKLLEAARKLLRG